MEKVCLKQKWMLPQPSYRGSVLIVHNLDILTLWHTPTIVPSPGSLIEGIQRTIVDFTSHGSTGLTCWYKIGDRDWWTLDLVSQLSHWRQHKDTSL